jgi:hypothetical protein
MIIGIDFDGTCVTHEYPNVGKDIGAVPILKALTKAGNQLILFTMRSDETLNDAVKWFEQHDIPLWGVNENPEQHTWTSSPKPHCNLFIDDAGLGCPLIFDKKMSHRPFVDWEKVVEMLQRKID